MDLYSYFLHQFSEGGNPYNALERCEGIVCELMDNPQIPTRISLAAASDLLAAITDYAGNGCAVAASFRRVRQMVLDVCQRMHGICRAEDHAWRCEQEELEGIPSFNPGDYECWPPDYDNGEDEGGDEEEELPDVMDTVQESFCAHCNGAEPDSDRRPFPDWLNCDKWTSEDWVRFAIHKEKLLAVAALHDFSSMHIVTDAIAIAKAHTSMLPPARKAEVVLWCKNLADELCAGLESGLQELRSDSIGTHL